MVTAACVALRELLAVPRHAPPMSVASSVARPFRGATALVEAQLAKALHATNATRRPVDDDDADAAAERS